MTYKTPCVKVEKYPIGYMLFSYTDNVIRGVRWYFTRKGALTAAFRFNEAWGRPVYMDGEELTK